jgi:hypothetical protein
MACSEQLFFVIVAWSGHRPDLFRDPNAARAVVESIARELAQHQHVRFLVGGQRGVDTWAALAAVATGIPFSLVLPCDPETFTRDWAEIDRAVLARTAGLATEVRIADGYSARNQVLADIADQLVAVWTRIAGGGTAETIDLARQAGKSIREIVLEPSPAATEAQGRGI